MLSISLFAWTFVISILLEYSESHNLVVDTSPKLLGRYFENIKDVYVEGLNGKKLPDLSKKRRFGKIDIEDAKIEQVDVERVRLMPIGVDYQLKITHLHAKLTGAYRHNVLILKAGGDFTMNIRDLNATLGPLKLINYEGIPFIDPEFNCKIHHEDDKVQLFNHNMLNLIAKYRLQETMRKDLDHLVCTQLTEILEQFLTSGIQRLMLDRYLPCGSKMNLQMEYDPLLLPGKIRTFHYGVAVNTTERISMSNPLKLTHSDESDFTFYVHQNLFTEAVAAVCKTGLFNKFFKIDSSPTGTSLNFTCLDTTVSLERYTGTDRAALTITALYQVFEDNVLESETKLNKTLMVSLLHGPQMVIYFRVVSEVVSAGEPERFLFGNAVSRHLFVAVREYVMIPMPTIQGVKLTVTGAEALNDRIIIGVNVEK